MNEESLLDLREFKWLTHFIPLVSFYTPCIERDRGMKWVNKNEPNRTVLIHLNLLKFQGQKSETAPKSSGMRCNMDIF